MGEIESTTRKMRRVALAKCKERIDIASQEKKEKIYKPTTGISAIMKSKYLIVIMSIICICISPVFAIGIIQNNTVTTPTVIELGGDGSYLSVAYLGEYVDITKVVGWTGQFGFWYGYPSAGSKPDIIVDASTFQHRYWIDPSKYRVGIWYKWDGAWEPAANSEAFEIKYGTRPAPVPTEPARYNFTDPKITPLVTPIPEEKAPVHIVIARGDELTYSYKSSDNGINHGYIWLFGKIQSILGDEMERNSSTYSYPFREEVTQNLQPGWYYGYLQFSNGRPDVWYNTSHKVGEDMVPILETPYDDAIIPDVSTDGWLPEHIQADFELLESNKNYCKDELVKITMEVVDPTVQFTDYYEEDDNIVIMGKSPIVAGTNISFVIDPDHYVKGYTLNSHTFTTQLFGKIDEPRRFKISIPVDWAEMAIEEHEVVSTLDRLKIHLTNKKEFHVTSIWANPTPIQVTEKIVVDGNGWHRVNVTPTPTPTPQIIYVTSTPEIVYVYITTNTTATPTHTPTPESTEETPIDPILGVFALVGVAYIVSRKR